MRATRSTSAYLIAALAALALARCAAAPIEDADILTAEDGMPLGRLGDAVRPTHYALDLRVDPSEETFSGRTTISVVLTEPTDRIWLHGHLLEVEDASLALPDGRVIEAGYEERNATGSAMLTLAETAPAGEAVLSFTYSAPFNDTSYGMLRQARDGRWYAATQFEPIAARWVFPSFDEPGFKVPFDIAVTARADDVVVTNTPEVSREDAGGGFTRRVFETTEPLPTYLIAFAVGPYDYALSEPVPPNDVRGEPLPLGAIAVAGLGQRLAYALDHTDDILSAHEGYFGEPYPYAKLDLIAMPSIGGFGAMENAGAITYNEYLLLMDERSPLAQRRQYTSVHAHELAHMWFGDLVTPAWWTDIWLNESFATWMAAKTAQAAWPEGEFDRETVTDALTAMRADSLATARRIREPVLRDAEIGDAFDDITYEKGASVLAMLEAYVGEEAFREGVRTHIRRFPYGTATADDFMQSLADGSGRREIVPAFRSFIDQPGVPLIETTLECPARGAARVRVRQSRYAPLGSAIDRDAQLWRIPACVSYVANGAEGRACSLISQREGTIALDSPSCPDAIHPNADGAGYYRFALDEAGWAALAARAPELPATEALAAVDSLDAAFRAGEVSAEAYVGGLAALAEHPAWDVVTAVADSLEDATMILSDAQLEAAQPGLARIFRDRYEALAGAEESGDLLLRASLARFLAVVAEEPEVRGAMTAQAAERIGVRGAADWSAIEPDLLETTLSVGVQELDDRFFELLLAEARASDDPAFRRDALGALARVEDPASAAVLRETIEAGSLRGGESLTALGRQLARRATQAETWAWIKDNDERVLELTPETFRSGAFASLGASFCSPELAAEFTALVEAHAESLPGYERSLAQTQERIALCVALKEASADDLAAALSALGG